MYIYIIYTYRLYGILISVVVHQENVYPYDDLTSGDRKKQKVSRSTSVRVDRVAKMLHLALIFWTGCI